MRTIRQPSWITTDLSRLYSSNVQSKKTSIFYLACGWTGPPQHFFEEVYSHIMAGLQAKDELKVTFTSGWESDHLALRVGHVSELRSIMLTMGRLVFREAHDVGKHVCVHESTLARRPM